MFVSEPGQSGSVSLLTSRWQCLLSLGLLVIAVAKTTVCVVSKARFNPVRGPQRVHDCTIRLLTKLINFQKCQLA